MKIYLVSPPVFLQPAPLTGIPVLKAYLKSQNINCHSIDLNIHFLHWLQTKGKLLDNIAMKIIHDFNQLQEKENLSQQETLNIEEIVTNLSLVPPALLEKHLKTKVRLGINKNSDPTLETWSKNPIRMTLILDKVYPAVTGKPPDPTHQTNFTRRTLLDTLRQFLDSEPIRSRLKKASQSDIVGISVPFTAEQLVPALIISQEIRRLNPDTFIIWGGSGLSMMKAREKRKLLISSGCIDAICKYEGENTLKELAVAVNNKNINKVPNLLYLDKERKNTVETPLQPPLHPDELPAPIFNHDELHLYSRFGSGWFPGIRVPVFVGRGCYWGKCAFCTDHMVQQPGQPKYLIRSSGKVVNDIKELQHQYHASYFYLITPALPPKWARQFSGHITREKISANFWAYLRAGNERTMDKSFFLLLKQAGFYTITCGVESTIDRVLETINKGNTRADIQYTIRQLSSAGIRTKFNLIIDIPPTTYEQGEENLSFVKDNADYIDELSVFDFFLADGSYMAQNPHAFNIRLKYNENGTPMYINQLMLAHHNPFYDSPRSHELAQRIKELARDLQFWKLTKKLQEKIDSSDFSWESGSIRFRPFTVIESCYSIRRRGKTGNVFYMFLEDMFKFVEIPGSFLELIILFQEAVKEPVEYRKFLEAFNQGIRESGYFIGSFPGEGVWNRLLYHFTHEGFIREIFSIPGFTPVNRRVFAGRGGIGGQHDLPFYFAAAPFACVPRKLLNL